MCRLIKTFISDDVADVDMHESNHFPIHLRSRFNLQHLTSLPHLTAAAETAAGLTVSVPATQMRDDDDTASAGAPNLRLNHNELWRRFAAVGTEMVITKSGRHAQVCFTHTINPLHFM